MASTNSRSKRTEDDEKLYRQLLELKQIDVESNRQSLDTVFHEALGIVSDVKGKVKNSDPSLCGRLGLAEKMLDFFYIRDPGRTSTDPPKLKRLPVKKFKNLKEEEFTDAHLKEIDKAERDGMILMGRHLLSNIHMEKEILNNPKCDECLRENDRGLCIVQRCKVSSLPFLQWPKRRLLVPCVTEETVKRPLYERDDYVMVSYFSFFKSIRKLLFKYKFFYEGIGDDFRPQSRRWVLVSDRDVRAWSQVDDRSVHFTEKSLPEV